MWENNEVQFARLLCELMASNEDLHLVDTAKSMDLQLEDLSELFNRAHEVFESAKIDGLPQCSDCGREMGQAWSPDNHCGEEETGPMCGKRSVLMSATIYPIRSIHDLFEQVREHPDFVAGAIFTKNDLPPPGTTLQLRGLADRSKNKWIEGAMVTAGSETLELLYGVQNEDESSEE